MKPLLRIVAVLISLGRSTRLVHAVDPFITRDKEGSVPGCEHRTGWRQISRLALVWLSLALPTVAAATPVKYQFSWQGTLVQSLSGVSANMSFTANTADVFTGMDPGGDFAVNLGPGFGGLTGVFSGAGLTGVFSGLEVSRESATSGPDLLLFRDQGSGANPIYELGLFADDPTGIGAYNLDAPFGPVNGNGVLSGSPSFDFGADGVLTFSAIDTASFEATTGPGGAITYGFSWIGTATRTLTDAHFEMSFTADTADVFTGMDPGGDFAVNLGPGFGGLTGVFSGAGLTGVFSGLEVSRESATSGPDLLLFRDQGSGANPIYELGLFADDPTGIGAYNLDAPFGPVNGNGVLSGSPSFDFGADGVLTFSAIDTASFEAVAIQQAPEPSALWLIIAGLLLGWWFLRKGKRSPV